jgi:hypothetical protein
MHLFGDASGPHLAHFHARHENGRVDLEWEVRNADEIRWRVLRSEQGYAESAEPPGANGQAIVNESNETYLCDEGLDPGRHYFYTVFSQEPDGGWRKQVEVRLRPHDLLGWLHPQAQDVVDAQGSLVRMPGASGLMGQMKVDGLTGLAGGRRMDAPWRRQSSAVRDWLTMDGGD